MVGHSMMLCILPLFWLSMLIQSGVLAQSVIVDAPWGLVRGYYEENGLGVSFQGIKYAQADRWQDPIPYSYGKNDAPFDGMLF